MPNIFDQVRRKGQVPVSGNHGASPRKPSPEAARSATVYQYGNGTTKVVDPVVAQLKEKRRLEKEKKEQEMRLKKGLPPKTAKSSKPSAPRPRVPPGAKQNSRPNGSRAPAPGSRPNSRGSAPPPSSSFTERKPPAKKLNFNDLMKKASTIDQSTLALSIKSKSRSPEHAKPVRPGSSSGRNSADVTQSNNPHGRIVDRRPRLVDIPGSSRQRPAVSASRAHRENSNNRVERREPQPITRAPIPVRGPSAHLLEKLKTKNTARQGSSASQRGRPGSAYGSRDDGYDSYDEDMDSFVVDDDDEEVEEEEDYGRRGRHSQKDAGYDRDEIWAMFNRGRKRSYYNSYDDDDSDDMEATGAEILEEETRSRRQAEVEDKRELEDEKRRAALKRSRFGH